MAKYQPGDLNVEAGHSAEWNFDGDPASGLPAGAEVFSGSGMYGPRTTPLPKLYAGLDNPDVNLT